jgi:glutaredoxin
MGIIKNFLMVVLALLVISACMTTEWKPTTFYHQDDIQMATPVKGEHIVLIFSTKWCYWCNVAKKWMNKQNVTYVDLDLETPGAKKKLKDFADSIGYTERLNSVPIFVINNKIYIGYNPEQIMDAIGRKKSKSQLFTTWETPLKQ